jgi:hypothetical protein
LRHARATVAIKRSGLTLLNRHQLNLSGKLIVMFVVLLSCCSAYIATLEQAVFWLNMLAAYVKDNSVTAWEQEASMAAEMAALLNEKLALTACNLAMQQQLAMQRAA